MYFRLYAIVFLFYEFTHEVVLPSILPCLGTLAHDLRRVAAEFLMDAGMTGETEGFQSLKSAVDSQPLHLVFGSGCLDRHHMMHTRCTTDVTTRDAHRLAVLDALLAEWLLLELHGA